MSPAARLPTLQLSHARVDAKVIRLGRFRPSRDLRVPKKRAPRTTGNRLRTRHSVSRFSGLPVWASAEAVARVELLERREPGPLPPSTLHLACNKAGLDPVDAVTPSTPRDHSTPVTRRHFGLPTDYGFTEYLPPHSECISQPAVSSVFPDFSGSQGNP